MSGRSGLRAALSQSWAERAQGEVTAFDYVLAARAALARPGVRWWWGQRIWPAEGRNGALCYVCGAFIESWQRSRPITRRAQDAIADHRASHLDDYGPTPAQEPKP